MDWNAYHQIPEPLGFDWEGKEVDPSQFKRAWFDVPYANQSPSQKLDIVLPERGSAPYPVVFYVPGGAWLSGGKRSATMACLYKVLSQGYAIAAIDYRYSTEALWPAQIFDVKAALRFVKAHAGEFSLDSSRIIAWGNSAGGHLVNMLAATGHGHVLEDRYQGNSEFDCSISGLISWYSFGDLYEADLCDQMAETKTYTYDPIRNTSSFAGGTVAGEAGSSALGTSAESPSATSSASLNASAPDPAAHGPQISGPTFRGSQVSDLVSPGSQGSDPASLTPFERLLGFEPRNFHGASAMASPIEFVDPSFPPALFQHGKEDIYVPCTQSVGMVRRINDLCGSKRAHVELFEGGHGSPAIKADANIDHCIDFMESIFSSAPCPRTDLPAKIDLR